MNSTSGLHTLVKPAINGDGVVVHDASRHVVRLRIIDHEFEISLKCEPVPVLTGLQLRAHGLEVHRRFDDVEVATTSSAQRCRRRTAMTHFGALSRTGSTGCRKIAAFLYSCSFLRACLHARKSFMLMPPACALGMAFATFLSL